MKLMNVLMMAVLVIAGFGIIGCTDAQIDQALSLAEQYLNDSGDFSDMDFSDYDYEDCEDCGDYQYTNSYSNAFTQRNMW